MINNRRVYILLILPINMDKQTPLSEKVIEEICINNVQIKSHFKTKDVAEAVREYCEEISNIIHEHADMVDEELWHKKAKLENERFGEFK